MTTLSIVTTCRDRELFLRHSIDSYINCQIAKEIIIVDFDSAAPLTHEAIGSEKCERVKILRVDDMPVWKIGLAQNIGIEFSSSEYFLKIDSDVSIVNIENTFKKLLNEQIDFARGLFSRGTSSGLMLTSKSLFSKIGGYNEWMFGWGGDDVDFYERLKVSGATGIAYFEPDQFREEKQEMATKNSASKTLLSNYFSHNEFTANPVFSSIRNTILSILIPQSENSRLKFTYTPTADSRSEFLVSINEYSVFFAKEYGGD
jgi:hypothetical protein